MQMICALLVLARPDLPAPLATLSPWLDFLGESKDDVYARLDGQPAEFAFGRPNSNRGLVGMHFDILERVVILHPQHQYRFVHPLQIGIRCGSGQGPASISRIRAW
jgi:hypothetical protein